MAQGTIITWNAVNWLTILIMVALGFGALAVVAQVFHNKMGTPPAA
jgi:hypothetical protein